MLLVIVVVVVFIDVVHCRYCCCSVSLSVPNTNWYSLVKVVEGVRCFDDDFDVLFTGLLFHSLVLFFPVGFWILLECQMRDIPFLDGKISRMDYVKHVHHYKKMACE